MQATGEAAAAEARYLDYAAASRYVGLSRYTLSRKVRAGELRMIKVGSASRFDREDLDRFMQERRS